MAVRESMANAVVHGNRYNAHKKVRIRVSGSPERLEIWISDQGNGLIVSACRTAAGNESAPQSGAGFSDPRLHGRVSRAPSGTIWYRSANGQVRSRSVEGDVS